MASDASMQAELAAFSKILEQNRTFVAVCTGVIVWDTIVTLPLELKHIWRTRLGAVSFFYLFNRYGTVAEMAVACYMGYWPSGDMRACHRVYLFEPYFNIFVAAAADCILILRAYAQWNKSKAVLAGLSLLLLVQIAIQAWSPSTATMLEMPPGLTGCLPAHADLYWVYYMVASIMSVALATATVARGIQTWKQGGRCPLNWILMRDGAFYFIVYMVANLANILYYAFADKHSNRAVLSSLLAIMTSVCASRVVFHIREAVSNGSSASRSLSIPSMLSRTKGNAGTPHDDFARSDLASNVPLQVVTLERPQGPGKAQVDGSDVNVIV